MVIIAGPFLEYSKRIVRLDHLNCSLETEEFEAIDYVHNLFFSSTPPKAFKDNFEGSRTVQQLKVSSRIRNASDTYRVLFADISLLKQFS
jgi:hypothetical protein